MPEALGTEILHLSDEFPSTATSEWEAVIAKDLKGADYEKKLVWRTEEGIAVRPYYRSDVLDQLGELTDLAPGEFPYTRGDGKSSEEAQNWIPPTGAIRALWTTTWHAIVVWCLVAPVAAVILYFALVPVLRRVARRKLVSVPEAA